MGNVVEFRAPNRNADQVARVPEEEALEYRVSAIMITISDLLHNGRVNEAERLWAAVRSGGYGIWTILPADLEKLINEANFEVGMYGRESDEREESKS